MTHALIKYHNLGIGVMNLRAEAEAFPIKTDEFIYT